MSLFTVLPVAGPARLDRAGAARALLWLPVVGALLGLPAGIARWAVAVAVPGPLSALVAAVVAVAVLGVLTGGLHLDGLADTADGVASRAPAAEALEIMRRPEVGPLGAAALLGTVLVQVAALAALAPAPFAAWTVLVAAVTARTAVVLAAGRRVPSARPDGFGALVAASVGARAARMVTVAVLVGVVTTGLAVNGLAAVRTGVVALGVGLLTGFGVQRLAQRRLGGMTGDVFGAVAEVTMAAALLSAAIVS